MTYTEKKEWETIDGIIAETEERLAKVSAEMATSAAILQSAGADETGSSIKRRAGTAD